MGYLEMMRKRKNIMTILVKIQTIPRMNMIQNKDWTEDFSKLKHFIGLWYFP